jgi:hypothetical protein
MALRALIEIRLSNETEESTSPERQREQDEAYCGIKGWDIVHVCRDLDVSRAVSPFDRGDLGKWLTASERPPIMSRSIFHVGDLQGHRTAALGRAVQRPGNSRRT